MHTTPHPVPAIETSSLSEGLPHAGRAQFRVPPARDANQKAMSELIESSEFGDWLVGEMSRAVVRARSANPERALAAALRQEALRVAKTVLLEFLILQQAMLDAASEARQS